MANPIKTRTTTPPPTAAPIRVPVVICGAVGVGACRAMPAKGLGDGESVGPGVSVGVTEGDAPIRNEGVGLGVGLGVMDEVTEGVGVDV